MSVAGDVVWLGELEGQTTSTVGRRALSLDRLMREGASVPPGFVVQVAAFRSFLEHGGLGRRIADHLAGLEPSDADAVEDASRRVVAEVAGAEVPRQCAAAIEESYGALSYGKELSLLPQASKGLVMGRNDAFVAVRTSHPADDARGTSLLNVRGTADVIEAVKRCWATRFEPERIPALLSAPALDVAVIVQRMAPAEAAGVVRTRAAQDPRAIEVRAVLGLASILGSFEAPGDRYLVDRSSLAITSRAVAPQAYAVVRDDVCERLERLERSSLGPAKGRAQKVPDAVVRELGALAIRLEGAFGSPLELSWAMARGKLSLIGARPLPQVTEPSEAEPTPPREAPPPPPAPPGASGPATPLQGLAVLPIGATEDHGPHLPPTTDTLIAEALAARVAARTGGRCLPAIPYGYCRTTSGLAATVSIGFDTVRALARDVASSLAGSGSRNVCVITGHGGSAHLAALQEGVREALSGREGVRAVVVSPWQLGVGDIVKEPPYHAGEAETSLVLAIAPELVHMELARAGPPPPPPAFVLPAPAPAAAVWGDPRLGTAEKGAAILSRWTDAVAGLLEAEPRSAE